MLSLSSYSQTDTTKVIVLDTTKVTIPTKVARLVFQDLLRYDGAKLEITELNKVITQKTKKLVCLNKKTHKKNQVTARTYKEHKEWASRARARA